MSLKLDTIIAFVIFVIVVVAAALYNHYHSKNTQTDQSTAGWAHYSSKQYGFQFDYPSNWGNPQITSTKGESGSHYAVAFNNVKAANKRDLFVSSTMDSEDYKRKVCQNGQCSVLSNVVTDKSVQLDLQTRADTFVNHDNSSYGFILNGEPANTTLQEQQIISLPAMKVSAAVATFTVSNATVCPSNKLAAPSQPLCINKGDYDTVNKFLKSIKSA